MAWIFLRTGQGVLLMVLFHASLDTMQFVMPIAETPNGTLTFAAIAAVGIVVAGIVISRVGRDLGSRRPENQRSPALT